jgi:hypothetical protein
LLGACGGGAGGSAEAAEVRASAAGTTRDLRPPRIYIKSPLALGRYTTGSPQITVGGTADDDTGLARVTWRNDRGGSGTATGTSNWSASGIALVPGNNRLTVEAFDAAGKSTSRLLIVSYTGTATAPAPTSPPSAANRAPVISGTPPASIAAGGSYSFTPSASDPDGQALTFSIRGAPAWASFNTANGALSGKPGPANVGTTSGIVITVSDGKSQTSLPAFSIAVVQGGTGTATVSWTPPSERTDGSSLTDLAGYRMRYGTNPSNLSGFVEIYGTGVSRFVVDGLTSGTWYFGLTAFDRSGRESSLSNLASKRIP